MRQRQPITLPSRSRIKELFDYNPETGILTWKVRFPSAPLGSAAGSCDKQHGYVVVKIDGIKYRAHRLIWLHYYGENPSKMVDHINGVRNDNRIANLRLADASENQANRGIGKNNKTGITGVFYRRPWGAQIKIRGKQLIIGYFETKEEAATACEEARRKFFGEFALIEKRLAIG